jgi:hypothetical protein
MNIWRNSLLEIEDIIPSGNYGCAFTNYKKYDKYPLNDLTAIERGLEPYRVLKSYEAAKNRGCSSEFLDTGVVILDDFYSSKDLSFILGEIHKFPLRVNKNSSNLLKNFPSYKSIANRMANSVFDTLKYLDKALFDSNTFIQRISKNSEGHLLEKGGKDAQFRIHTDIFSPAIKYWYFPEEVTIEHGPLMYAKNSCQPSKEIIDFWYRESVKVVSGDYIETWKQPSHSEGSLRISEEELKGLGYTMSSICVPANSLVLVNVHGFHRRGEHTKIRNSIHGSIRINNPFT